MPALVPSVNLVDYLCDEGHAFIKDYSENSGILAELIRLGLVEVKGPQVPVGPWCKASYVKVNVEKFNA